MAARRNPFKSRQANANVEKAQVKTPFDQYLDMTTTQKTNQLKDSLQLNIFDSLLTPINSVNNKVCDHQWTPYVGFTECYEFCAKCDCKKK